VLVPVTLSDSEKRDAGVKLFIKTQYGHWQMDGRADWWNW